MCLNPLEHWTRLQCIRSLKKFVMQHESGSCSVEQYQGSIKALSRLYKGFNNVFLKLQLWKLGRSLQNVPYFTSAEKLGPFKHVNIFWINTTRTIHAILSGSIEIHKQGPTSDQVNFNISNGQTTSKIEKYHEQ